MDKLIISMIIILITITSLVLVNGLEEESDSMEVEANILEPVASVEVPDYFFFGNLTRGYKFDPSSEDKIEINNTGTTDITVTPVLEDNSNPIFENICFSKTQKEDCITIGEYSFGIDKPNDMGDKEDEEIYIQLDLTEYTGKIEQDIIGASGEVIFYAMEQQ